MGRKSSKRARSPKPEEWYIRCVCGDPEEGKDDDDAWIACSSCGCWQHKVCMGVSPEDEELSENYKCEQCAPELHKELLAASARSVNLWEERRRAHEKQATEQEQIEHGDKKRSRKSDRKMRDSLSHSHGIDDTDEASKASNMNLFPLTDECHHYSHVSEVPWDIQKYWHQRNSIFSCYNKGIRMTDDAWFGVTPEPVAKKVAEDLAAFADPSKTIVIDIFGGVGGNSIAFALSGRWAQVITIEKDPSVIACAQHNAALYGVRDQITWVNDDCFSYLSSNTWIDPSKTVIFGSPPWGGPGYTSDKIFSLNTMQPYSAKQIHDACRGMDSALYLPRTSDLRQIARLAPKGKKVEVVQYCMEGASKAMVAYIPASPVATS